MKNKKYQTVGTVLKSYRKILERGKIDTYNIHIHDCSLSWFGTGTWWLVVQLVLWAQTYIILFRYPSSLDNLK